TAPTTGWRERLELPAPLPEKPIGIPIDPRGRPENRERAEGEDTGTDEESLKTAEPQASLHLVGVRPGLLRRKVGDSAGQARIVHQRRAATIGVEWLQRLKAEERRVTKRTHGAAAVGGPQRVGTVLDEGKPVATSEVQQRIHVAR